MSDESGKGDDSGKLLYCSFCGKSQHEVRKLIAGPSVFICDECVELCNDIIREEVSESGQTKQSDRLPVPQEINDILDDYVRPYLEYDGGGVEVHGIVGNQVMIRYQGACGTCPSATTGTMMAIESALQREIDPDIEVILV